MRTAFIAAMSTLAKSDRRVMLLTGDLGYSVFEKFQSEFPEQFLNCGVAEQNMIGVAAGLAMSGKKVFVYSIVPFVTFRCLEQIRNDICYHDLAVCIVGVGGGYSYGTMGFSHHAMEDIAVMRSLPNMTVICPGDPKEAEAAVGAINRLQKPCYLRLGKSGEPVVHVAPLAFEIGKAIEIVAGDDATIIATSTMLSTAMEVSARLTQKNIHAGVVSMHTVKPIDADALRRITEKTRLLVTLEEHSAIGGLGSAVAEAMALGSMRPVRHLLLAAPDAFRSMAGSQKHLLSLAKLAPDDIAASIEEAFRLPRTPFSNTQ